MKIKDLFLIVVCVLTLVGCASQSSQSDSNPDEVITEPVETEIISMTINGDDLILNSMDELEATPNSEASTANVELIDDIGEFLYKVELPYEALGLSGSGSFDIYLTSEIDL